MLDYRLRVFHAVAHRLNFTKAAESLNISQPAVTKNIKELESQLGIRLFNRKSGRVVLTLAGRRLLETADQIEQIYHQLDFDINILKSQVGGTLKLGASTTIGQYVLPQILARYHHAFPEVNLVMQNANTETIEELLLRQEITLGIVEGIKRNPLLSYISFMKDEIVPIAAKNCKFSSSGSFCTDDLKSIPFVCREKGSGSLEVLETELSAKGLSLSELRVEMMLGSTEAIKSFLKYYECIGFVSITAIADEVARGEFKIIDFHDLEIYRDFYFVHPVGVADGLSSSFINFTRHTYNR